MEDTVLGRARERDRRDVLGLDVNLEPAGERLAVVAEQAVLACVASDAAQERCRLLGSFQ